MKTQRNKTKQNKQAKKKTGGRILIDFRISG
jgi:hypothetical protein